MQLLLRGDEWYSNQEIVQALGLTSDRALLSNVAPTFRRALGESDAAIVSRGLVVPGLNVSAANTGGGRVFSRRALVLAAMRTNTVNAAAFRDWMASRVAGEVANG